MRMMIRFFLVYVPLTFSQEFSVECGICYAYRLGVGAVLPEIVCENSHCGQPFHHPCLLEVRILLFSPCWCANIPWEVLLLLLQWLRGLPTSRMSFNTIFGECPYCNQVSHIAACCSFIMYTNLISLLPFPLLRSHTSPLPSQSPSKHCTVINTKNAIHFIVEKDYQKFIFTNSNQTVWFKGVCYTVNTSLTHDSIVH